MADSMYDKYPIRQIVLIERERNGSYNPLKSRGVVLSRALTESGTPNWCIMYTDGDFVLSKSVRRFVMSPMNSSMTDKFWNDTRFKSVDAAIAWWEGAKGEAVRSWADGFEAARVRPVLVGAR